MSGQDIVESQIDPLVSKGTAILDGYPADYSFIDDQRIKIQAGIFGLVLTASINNNKLTLIDQASEACLLNHIS